MKSLEQHHIKKQWKKPTIFYMNSRDVQGGAITGANVEGVKFGNSLACGHTGTVIGTKPGAHSVFADACFPACFTNTGFAVHGTIYTGYSTLTSVGLCS